MLGGEAASSRAAAMAAVRRDVSLFKEWVILLGSRGSRGASTDSSSRSANPSSWSGPVGDASKQMRLNAFEFA